MSHLAAAIEQLLAEKKLKSVEVSKRSGIPQSQLSRWRSGEQVWIDAEDLEKLAAAIGKEKLIHARLLRAHLLDECRGPGSPMISIEIANQAAHLLQEPATPYRTKLPPKLEHAMNVVADRILSEKDLQKIILSLGNLYEKGTLE